MSQRSALAVEILAEIAAERVYQMETYGHQLRSEAQWITTIRAYLEKAEAGQFHRRMVQVAALAAAAVESRESDREERWT